MKHFTLCKQIIVVVRDTHKTQEDMCQQRQLDLYTKSKY